MKRTIGQALTICIVTVGLLSCDPNQIVNDFFAKQGLNRLAVLRDDIQPGGLVLADKNGAVYADNILDYVNSSDEVSIPITVRDGTSEFDAVIRSYAADRTVDPSATLNFVKQILPIDFSGEFKLTSNVSIDQINAKVRRMKIPDVRRFLASDAANGLKAEIDIDLRQKLTPYIIYEIWSTNKIKLVADGGKDISTSVTVGQIGKLVSGAKGSFTYKKTDKSTLEISGDKYYVFAIRTGKLEKNGNAIDFLQTKFVPPSGFGVKAAGTDTEYSSNVSDNGVTLLKDRAQ